MLLSSLGRRSNIVGRLEKFVAGKKSHSFQGPATTPASKEHVYCASEPQTKQKFSLSPFSYFSLNKNIILNFTFYQCLLQLTISGSSSK